MGMRRFCAAVILFVVLIVAAGCERSPEGASSTSGILSHDGAWSWFQDPRAVYVEGQYKRTYAGWVTQKGVLQVGAYDHQTGRMNYYALKEDWEVDDHSSNSLLVLPDKRLMACYTRHNERGLFCRSTSKPEDIRVWDDEVTVAKTPCITYSQPVYLSDEGRFYVFWRGSSWKPTFAWSTDSRNWSEPRILIQEKDRETEDVRPYMKVASDSKARIDFAFTDGHPHDETLNSIYYLRYEKGAFYKANGTKVGDMNSLPIGHHMSDVVYDGKATNVRAWIWDIGMDKAGFPVIVYTRLPKETDHRYHYARWTGDAWIDTEIIPAGQWFPLGPHDAYYSGGIALDHSDPSVVYLSRPINGVFELEKWTTANQGRTWSSMAITKNSGHPNVRPVVPRGYTGKEDHVLWMHGDYVHYTKYDTAIRMLTPKL
jgi:hypothetical protein